jgi:hypothetical protein
MAGARRLSCVDAALGLGSSWAAWTAALRLGYEPTRIQLSLTGDQRLSDQRLAIRSRRHAWPRWSIQVSRWVRSDIGSSPWLSQVGDQGPVVVFQHAAGPLKINDLASGLLTDALAKGGTGRYGQHVRGRLKPNRYKGFAH